jgi:hypothetical protein
VRGINQFDGDPVRPEQALVDDDRLAARIEPAVGAIVDRDVKMAEPR